MVILKADGSVVPIITSGGIPSLNYAANPCAGDNETLTAEQTPVSDPNIAASYYLDDHLGTTQMELSSGGWPVWSGAFTPFGQEIINGTTTNYIGAQPADGTAMHYKFTGKERDAESGLDYFGARYYGSNMGRWMSPDNGYTEIAGMTFISDLNKVAASGINQINFDGDTFNLHNGSFVDSKGYTLMQDTKTGKLYKGQTG
jgi:RHS repeat-associated protein